MSSTSLPLLPKIAVYQHQHPAPKSKQSNDVSPPQLRIQDNDHASRQRPAATSIYLAILPASGIILRTLRVVSATK